ncbi:MULTISPECIES: TolC family protein [Flavobacterium]|uniref:Outer membrane protein TolC n=2 Tax=Flavobacterium TaxID=237 RepID=A0A1M6J1S9_9FLAO|nr:MULTISPECIES: TolC family protein [Flavobacterium]BCY28321.1 transporter [Flavobacterium okayamense]SHJ40655.1 Outer membrane protein TolC [Flavobacterium haoranii]
MMKYKIVIISFFLFQIVTAQEQLTLEKCYQLVETNYPLAKQNSILANQLEVQTEAFNKDKLPKISLNAQATYQSEVTQVPFSLPNATIEPLNKDQYRATLDVNQLIYNGNVIEAQTNLKTAQTKTQQQQVKVTLYQLKSVVNQYYFGILLLQKKQELVTAKKVLLLEKIKEIQAAVKFDAVLPSSEQVIEAEIIKINQQSNDIRYEKLKLFNYLNKLTDSNFNEDTVLVVEKSIISQEGSRPEYKLFELQNQQIDANKSLISKTNYPKVNAFAQGGYGNPALNMLNNSFETFYMAGIRLNWTLFDWNKTKKEKEALEISKQLIETEKETFELNINSQLQEVNFEIERIEQQIISDAEIIQLREKIVLSAEAQMKNGVITSSDYLNEVTQLFEAKINEQTHKVQLELAKANYQIIKGN